MLVFFFVEILVLSLEGYIIFIDMKGNSYYILSFSVLSFKVKVEN